MVWGVFETTLIEAFLDAMEDVKIKQVEDVDAKEVEVEESQPEEDAKELRVGQSDNDDEIDPAKNSDHGAEGGEPGTCEPLLCL